MIRFLADEGIKDSFTFMNQVNKKIDHALATFVESLGSTSSFECPSSGTIVQLSRRFSRPAQIFGAIAPLTVPDINEFVGCCDDCVLAAERHYGRLLISKAASNQDQSVRSGI